MADVRGKTSPHVELRNTDEDSPNYLEAQQASPHTRPRGWKYGQPAVFGKSGFWYASPKTQLLLVSFVCFLCPGMFNAVNGLGAGGQVSAQANDDALTALYATFAGVGFFAGSFANRLGLRITMALGGVGYPIYVGSLLCYNHTQNQGFLIFAGALLGLCAGLLWTAQGAIMMSYPAEGEKGRFIGWFWVIFNMGAVIGGLIPLGQNIHTTTSGAVNDGTYTGFIVLMLLGAVLALALCDADDIVRPDGSKVIVMKNPTWKSEFVGLYETIASDPYIILLFPMFLSSNWFYTYHFNGMNGAHFDVRTRALNSVLYYVSQIIGSFIFGYCLDFKKFSRSLRARVALIALFSLTMIIWGGGYAWQSQFPADLSEFSLSGTVPAIDFADGSYIGPMFLYMFYGFYDSIWQTCVYWYMGALSNSGRKTANYAGFYKGLQSAGAAICWQIDGKGTPYTTQFASTWGVLAGSLVVAAPVIFLRIKDHVTVEEDLKLSDETLADILPDQYAEKGAEA